MATTIKISDNLWKILNGMKKERGETFEDIIMDMVNLLALPNKIKKGDKK